MRFKLKLAKFGILFVFTIFLTLFFSFDNTNLNMVQAYPEGSPPGYSSAPNEATCTACHSQSAGSGQFILGLPASYSPGQTYTIQVQHSTTDLTRKRWGFQLTALRSTNTAAGTFANTTSNTQLDFDSGRNYINQSNSGTFRNQTGGATWTFNWTAPATDVGAIRFYASGLQANNANGDNGDRTYTASQTIQPAAPPPAHQFLDFDGDGKSDPAVFRPSEGIWYINQSTNGFMASQFGLTADKLTPADYDGDNRTDIAVWREDIVGVAAFYILQSSTNTVRIEQFGQNGDDPSIVGDWDGDGKADISVYRDSAFGSQSYFFYLGSMNNPGGNTTYLPWGTTGDKPLRGDFDGDGQLDLAVFRPTNKVWYIRQSSNGQIKYDNWGLPTDIFVQADYDGDGVTDPAVFRNGVWYIKQSTNNQIRYDNWGIANDIPVPADYDGDAKMDVAIYRDGIWYIKQSSSGSMSIDYFGVPTDRVVEGAIGQ
jgi:hypothetical protein